MSERTVLITGCSSGFGLGIAKALQIRGWDVIGCVRDVHRVSAQLPGVQLLSLDLSDDAQIFKAASSIDRLDCLINNAGYGLNGPFSTYTPEQMRKQMQVNFSGPVLLTQQLLPALIAARGRIINISSLAGELGLPMNAMYCASKFAMEGFTESLLHELAEYRVQVALVEPGGFRTRFVNNVEWGERPIDADSLVARHLAAYRALQAKIVQRGGNDPQRVVDAVVRLVESTTMPLRTRVGKDAKGLHWLQRCFPERTAVALVGSIFRRAMNAESNK